MSLWHLLPLWPPKCSPFHLTLPRYAFKFNRLPQVKNQSTRACSRQWEKFQLRRDPSPCGVVLFQVYKDNSSMLVFVLVCMCQSETLSLDHLRQVKTQLSYKKSWLVLAQVPLESQLPTQLMSLKLECKHRAVFHQRRDHIAARSTVTVRSLLRRVSQACGSVFFQTWLETLPSMLLSLPLTINSSKLLPNHLV